MNENEVSKEIPINQAVELAKKYCDDDAINLLMGFRCHWIKIYNSFCFK